MQRLSARRLAAVTLVAVSLSGSHAPRAVRAQSPEPGILTLVDQTAGASYAMAADGGTRLAIGAGRRAYLVEQGADGPRVVGRTPPLPATVRAILFDGTRLFVAAEGGTGIHVFDIADPAAPARLGVIPATHEVREMVRHGDHLIAAEFGEGVVLYDVSGALPQAPLSVEHTHRAVTYVAAVDDRVYAAYSTEGLGIIDIATPSAPRFLGEAELPKRGRADSVAVEGTTAVLAVGTALGVYDVADPAAPTLVATIEGSTSILCAALHGTHLYVALGTDGVGVYDLRERAAPALLRKLPTPNDVVRLRVVADRLSVVDWLDGLTTYDLATPDTPTVTGHVDGVSGYPYGVLPVGDVVYAGLAHSRLAVIDAASMREVGSAPLEPTAQDLGLAVRGDRLAVGDLQSGLYLFDIAAPRSPKQLLHTAAEVRDLVVLDDGRVAASGGGQGLALWDLTDAARPQRWLRTGTPAFMWGLTADADHIYVADRENGLTIYTSRPVSSWPVFGQVALGTGRAPARDVAFLDANTVAVSSDEGGLFVVDVTDRAAPRVLGSVNTRFKPIPIAVHDNLVFAGGRARGIAVYDATDRAAPRFVGQFDLTQAVTTLEWSGDRLYAAAGTEGILAFELGQVPAPGTVVEEHGPLSSTVLPTEEAAASESTVQRPPTPTRLPPWRIAVAVLGGLGLALAVVAAGRWGQRRWRRSRAA